jgi:SAM-dependent methyltransferase
VKCPKCGETIRHWCYGCAVVECPSHPRSTNPSPHIVLHLLGDNECPKFVHACPVQGVMAVRVNLGCGTDIRDGWVNIDRHDAPGVIQYDISRLPLPFESGVVDEILASHVLEHLPCWEDLMPELHRILRPGGILEVRVPYKHDFQPWHYRAFDKRTFASFYDGTLWAGSTSLDTEEPGWTCVERRVDRQNLLEWHQKKYLGRMVVRLPLGRRWQIVWRLRKRAGEEREHDE